jgi:RNA polymerase sigma factor for flagellar operon FliA
MATATAARKPQRSGSRLARQPVRRSLGEGGSVNEGDSVSAGGGPTRAPYAAGFSIAERQRVILENIPLVHHVLSGVAAHFPPYVDRSDLLEAGMLGLIDAADRYDTGRNVRFQTYAMSRIRGAMLDALRSDDWLPRSVRSGLGRIMRVSAELEQEAGRRPSTAEISRRSGLDEPTVARLKDMATRTFYSLEGPPQTNAPQSEPRMWHGRHDLALQPADHAIRQEEAALLAEAILRLTKTERLVITLYYFERLPLREIAEVLGVTDSRVCQIHRATLKRLEWILTGRARVTTPAPAAPRRPAPFPPASRSYPSLAAAAIPGARP